ncbi:glycosyltransferase [Geopyxis carbonaria]|nr:glycosyltransferase [Geopyxis carbonaria]
MDRLRSLHTTATRLLFSSRTKFPLWLLLPLLLGDALLNAAIILKVPYTEIDWTAYHSQIATYLSGERDYALLKGGTGPLVYPAAHVYIYQLLHGLSIPSAQWVFAALYLCTLLLVGLCYREARAPAFLLPLLCASKRLHSIYVLRLFNDGWAVLFFWAAVLAWQRRKWTVGSVAFSIAVGVKMGALLALPGVGAVYLLALGRGRALAQAGVMAAVQAGLGAPFLARFPKSYLSRAFEFTRVFMFRWTVNWRFVGEEVFLSRAFAAGLLGVHVLILAVFLARRWCRPAQRSFWGFVKLIFVPPPPAEQAAIARRVDARFVLTTVLAANAAGMLCARSLHYQFYAWLAWGAPFLLWRAGLGPAWTLVLWAAQEWAWNVFPSTNVSSGVVVGVLVASVAGVYWGTRSEGTEEEGGKGKKRV